MPGRFCPGEAPPRKILDQPDFLDENKDHETANSPNYTLLYLRRFGVNRCGRPRAATERKGNETSRTGTAGVRLHLDRLLLRWQRRLRLGEWRYTLASAPGCRTGPWPWAAQPSAGPPRIPCVWP